MARAVAELLGRAGAVSLLWWAGIVASVAAVGLVALLFLARWGEDFDRGSR